MCLKPTQRIIAPRKELHAEQQATSGTRLEYDGHGDEQTMRTDTFTFDGGHLVKIDMVYVGSTRTFRRISSEVVWRAIRRTARSLRTAVEKFSEPVLNAFGVKYDAHRAIWLGNQNVISIIEQPGEDGRTEIIAETLRRVQSRSPSAKDRESPAVAAQMG